jgi:hypothetical protein
MIGCRSRDQPIQSDSPLFTLNLQRCFSSLCLSSAVGPQVSKVCGIRLSDARAMRMQQMDLETLEPPSVWAWSSRVPCVSQSLPSLLSEAGFFVRLPSSRCALVLSAITSYTLHSTRCRVPARLGLALRIAELSSAPVIASKRQGSARKVL